MQVNRRRLVRGFRVFSSAADAGRVRRPTDVVLLILGLLGAIALILLAPGPSALDQSLSSMITSLPGLVWRWTASWLPIVPVGTKSAAGKPSVAAASSSRRSAVGSSR